MPVYAGLHVDEATDRGKAILEACLRHGLQGAPPSGPEPALHIVDLATPGAPGYCRQIRDSTAPLVLLFTAWKQVAGVAAHLAAKRSLLLVSASEPLELALTAATKLVRQRHDRLQKKLGELRQSFARRLPERTHELTAAIQAMSTGASTDALKEARRLAHSLKGAAATFGFPRLTALAKRFEDALNRPQGGAQTARLLAELQTETETSTAGNPWVADVVVFDEDPAFIERVAANARDAFIHVTGETSLEAAGTHADADGFLISTAYGAHEDTLRTLREFAHDPQLRDIPLAFHAREGAAEPAGRILAQAAGAHFFLDDALNMAELAHAARVLANLRRHGPPRVLLVDDDADFAQYLEAVLTENGLEVTTLADPEDTLAVLARVEPELVLLDVTLPSLNGFDVCRMLRMNPRWQDLPVLFLTARSGSVPRIVAFQAGGDDFVHKPIVTDDLVARIQQRIDRARMLKNRLERDHLTGVETRAAFFHGLAHRLAAGRAAGEPLALLLLDLDQFKAINDTHGHATGDRVLAGFGNFLLRTIRATDPCGRFGGDEFGVAMPGLSANEAAAFAERLRHEWSGTPFHADDGRAFSVTFSAGMAYFPEDGDHEDVLFARADERLRKAKSAGRDLIELGKEP